MEPRVNYKDIPIGEKTYRLTKMDPRLACWLFSKLSSNMEGLGRLVSTLGRLPREEFDEVQRESLKFVQTIEVKDGQSLPTPVFSMGVIVDKSLGGNPAFLMKATCECIMFNISPFLEESESTPQTTEQ
jgi:hypothetical protein